jgi:hypothetical protein
MLMNGKVLMLCTALLIQGVVTSCSRQKPEVLATRIQYDVPVQNNDPQLDWWINNLEGSKRDPFIKRVIEAAEKGDVKTFDYFNNPLTPAQVKASFSDTVYQTFARNYPPYEEYDTMIILTLDYRNIQKIRFLEEWRWDPENLTMQKEILGFGPLIQKEVAGATFNQLLFWIMF